MAECIVLRHTELLNHFSAEPVFGRQRDESAHRLVFALAVPREKLQNREHLYPVDLRDVSALYRGDALGLARERWHLDGWQVVPAPHARPLGEPKQHRTILPHRFAHDLAQSSAIEVLDARWGQRLDVGEPGQELYPPRLLTPGPITLAHDRRLNSGEPLRNDRRKRPAFGCVYLSSTR
ncbi:MAG: hypothetical protein WBM96_08255 [Polyangiales bacterium]